jgi:hypothetical protein
LVRITGRAQEDHDVVLGEVLVGERGSVLRRVDVEPATRGHLRDRDSALRNALRVPEGGRLGEDQRAEVLVVVRVALSMAARAVGSRRCER